MNQDSYMAVTKNAWIRRHFLFLWGALLSPSDQFNPTKHRMVGWWQFMRYLQVKNYVYIFLKYMFIIIIIIIIIIMHGH